MSSDAVVDGARRWLPERSSPLNPERVGLLLERERSVFRAGTTGSQRANERAMRTMPLGVPSSFQYWDPYPVSIASATGAHVTDADGRRLLDLSMGFGALLVGHLHPQVVSATQDALRTGTLFVAPSAVTAEAAERVCRRFDLETVRFTNSGTESLMYAIRAARIHTGRRGVIKVEGGYHGGYDPLTVSVKPSLDLAGPATEPFVVSPEGVETGDVQVIPFNDAEALERLLEANPNRFAVLVMEPVLACVGLVC